MDPQIQEAAITCIADCTDYIPSRLSGVDRQKFIAGVVGERLDESRRSLLRQYFEKCLQELRFLGASDIDLGGEGDPRLIWVRINGVKRACDLFPLPSTDSWSLLIQTLLSPAQSESLHSHGNLDFSYSIISGGGQLHRYRADAYYDNGALALNFRVIDVALRNIEQYGFHPHVMRALNLAHVKEGLILVTGITGSGKSSTLDAIVDFNNSALGAHIVIIASPLEFIHKSRRALVRHREVGRDTGTFKSGIVEALRQDPDVIVVGEMRDPATIMAALEAADSGHKVISTLHTSSAIESIERIIAETPSIEQNRVRMRLAAVLKCVISQKLVPLIGGGRILAKEVMLVSPSIQAAIKNNNTEEIYQMLAEGKKYGMNSMEQDLRRLVAAGKISIETAESFANNKRMMAHLLAAAA